ncbi:hypothetical protein, partial [Pseudothermotoga sp.]
IFDSGEFGGTSEKVQDMKENSSKWAHMGPFFVELPDCHDGFGISSVSFEIFECPDEERH